MGQHYMPPARQGLYDPANEHDACGLGFIAHIKGQKTHAIVNQALLILRNLTHRGATGADPLTGAPAGVDDQQIRDLHIVSTAPKPE